MNRPRLLLGAMLTSSDVLDAVAPIVDPMTWAGDERLAVLGVISLRAMTPAPARVTALVGWLHTRGVKRPSTVLRPALEAFERADPMTLDAIVDLARELSAQPEVSPCPSA